MEKLKFNPNNAKYYSEDFINGFECGVERQFEKDKAELTTTVRGKWIEIQNGELAGIWKCSNCEEIALFQVEYWSCKQKQTPFCPFCGAKMEESGGNQ